MKNLLENDTLRLILVVSSNLIRYFLFAGIFYFIFYVWKRKAWFSMKIQQKFPEKSDILREILYSLSTILIFGIIGFAISLAKRNGFTQIYENIADKGWGYWFFSLGLLIFIHDTWFYWTHRWMHSSPKIYRIFHRVHHLSHNPSPWAAFAFHPSEAVVEAMFLPIAVFIFPFHFTVLALFLTWMIVMNVFGHTGYEIIPKKLHNTWLGKLYNTPTHHNMHHQLNKGNFSLYFNIWDLLMGTNFKNYEEEYEKNASHQIAKVASKELV